MDNTSPKRKLGFTATYGLKNANRGPFFLWLDGKCANALTVNSWWHQNFILEYVEIDLGK